MPYQDFTNLQPSLLGRNKKQTKFLAKNKLACLMINGRPRMVTQKNLDRFDLSYAQGNLRF